MAVGLRPRNHSGVEVSPSGKTRAIGLNPYPKSFARRKWRLKRRDNTIVEALPKNRSVRRERAAQLWEHRRFLRRPIISKTSTA